MTTANASGKPTSLQAAIEMAIDALPLPELDRIRDSHRAGASLPLSPESRKLLAQVLEESRGRSSS